MRNKKIQLLDCTLRDGAYIVNAKFGSSAIHGIVSKLKNANIDIIECGWLKDDPHQDGTTFYHVPDDLLKYVSKSEGSPLLVAMIDWDRYDVSSLPPCDGESLDAIRIVFPHGKYREGILVGKQIAEKGYKVCFQAANTLAYTDDELKELAAIINQMMPESLSVVDTFGAMYGDDLERIVRILDNELDTKIKLGFHSHNNQQLSFSLTMQFVEMLEGSNRECIVDASLCGMGRGAGNAPTELVADYLNRKWHGNYDMDQIMDTIDIYMQYFQENYEWGYSTPYFIAGKYCCHVNNIAYLQRNHRTSARDMHAIIDALAPEERMRYDYDLLEKTYLENQSRVVDDEETLDCLEEEWSNREVLLIAPGKSSETDKLRIFRYIDDHHPVVVGVNAINPSYQYDDLFIINAARYDYLRESYPDIFHGTRRILLSNIKTQTDENELIVRFDRVIVRGYKHFDNAVVYMLRLLSRLHVKKVSLVGFDGFKHKYNESYADELLPTINPDNKWDELNEEIHRMFQEFRISVESSMEINFLTESIFEPEL